MEKEKVNLGCYDMLNEKLDAETQKVASWWNRNPFTYNGTKGVGFSQEKIGSLEFFEKIERRFRRHGSSYQMVGKPLLSNFFDYTSLRGKKVLDIATGTGLLTIEFARQGALVTGIDITEFAVRTTKRNLSLRNLSGEALQMDAQDLKFKDNTFDFACAHGCLMHMPDTQKAINEIHRVLKKNGKTHAWIYHKGWYYYFGIILFRGLVLGQLLRYNFNTLKLTSRYTDGSSIGGNPHTKFHSSDEAKAYFVKAGFKNIQTKIVYNPSEFQAWPFARFSVGQFLPEFIKRYLAQQLMQLHHEASNRNDPIIVELGVDKGQSTKVFLNAIHNKPNATLISIDIRDCSEAVKADNWEFVRQDSADVDALLRKKPILRNGIDILYVDSKHTPQHVTKEVFGFFEYMKKGSVIFFDDIDCGPYMNGQRKDSVSNEIAFRNIFNLLEAIFRANYQSIDFAISRGSTGLAGFTKISNLGAKLNPPVFFLRKTYENFLAVARDIHIQENLSS